MTIFSFFGPPGAGKGTLAQKCQKQYGFKVLSTGNLCRQHVNLGTEFGKLISEYIAAGDLIPDGLVTNIVIDWLITKSEQNSPVILDGYPRTSRQAEYFLEKVNNFLPDYKFKVICFIISEEESLDRLRNRVICDNKSCQIVYSPLENAARTGICDACGCKLSKRSDDQVSVVQKRLSKYSKYRDDILGFYKKADLKVEELDVCYKSAEQVLKDFEYFLNA